MKNNLEQVITKVYQQVFLIVRQKTLSLMNFINVYLDVIIKKM